MSENPTQVTRIDDDPELKAAPTIVVIKSNGRSLSSMLFPPAVIIILALAILSYQKQTPIRSLSTVATAAHKPVIKVDESVKPAETPAIVARLESRTVNVPPPALPEGLGQVPPSVTNPFSESTPAQIEEKAEPTQARAVDPSLARRLAMRTPFPSEDPPADETAPALEPPKSDTPPAPDIPTLPVEPPASGKPSEDPSQDSPATEPAPAPTPRDAPTPPKVTKEEVEADIKREAAAKEQELRKMEQLKPPRLIDQIEQARRVAQQKRAPFHADLRKLLKLSGKSAGPQIESLCDQYGRTPLPEIRNAVGKTLKRTHGGLSRQARVEMMRSLGLPEANILEYIANDVHSSMNTPSGPKDPDEVWVYAARLLLAIPVNSPKKAIPKANEGSAAPNPAQRAAATPGPNARGRAK